MVLPSTGRAGPVDIGSYGATGSVCPVPERIGDDAMSWRGLAGRQATELAALERVLNEATMVTGPEVRVTSWWRTGALGGGRCDMPDPPASSPSAERCWQVMNRLQITTRADAIDYLWTADCLAYLSIGEVRSLVEAFPLTADDQTGSPQHSVDATVPNRRHYWAHGTSSCELSDHRRGDRQVIGDGATTALPILTAQGLITEDDLHEYRRYAGSGIEAEKGRIEPMTTTAIVDTVIDEEPFDLDVRVIEDERPADVRACATDNGCAPTCASSCTSAA